MSGTSIANDLQNKIQSCREQKFTGVLNIEGQPVEGQPARWTICFLLGQITWTQSRVHALRRWMRSFKLYSPDLFSQISQHKNISQKAWNYTSLAQLVKSQKLSENKLSSIIESVVVEDLFDILQTGTYLHARNQQPLTYTLIEKSLTIMPAVLINHERAWREVQEQWSDWSTAGLADYSPDWGLEITDLEALKLRTSSQSLRILQTCCDSTSTLRDIAVKLRQPALTLMQSMQPYLSERLVAFTEIPNLVEDIDHGFSLKLFAHGSLVTSPIKKRSPAADHSVASRRAAIAQNNQPVASPALSTTSRPALNKETIHTSAVDGVAVNRSASGVAVSRPPVSRPPVSKSSASTLPRRPSVAQPSAKDRGSVASQQNSRDRAKPSAQNPASAPLIDAPLVVYIDDSPADSRAMAEVVERRGYRYSNVADPIQALPVLLEIKPELIFLDLVMPIANGYEVCAQIRRVSAFKQTPIIIVTSNDGVADRVRAKIVGASGFLGKPIQDEKVAKVLRKHLPSPPPRAYERIEEATARPTNKPMAESMAESMTEPMAESIAKPTNQRPTYPQAASAARQTVDRPAPVKQSLGQRIGRRLKRLLFS